MIDIETIVKKHVQEYLEKKADEIIKLKVNEVEQALKEASYSAILDAVAKVKVVVTNNHETWIDVRIKADL